jgi:hypothetical protein
MKKNIRVHFSELLQCFGGEFVVLLFNKVKGDTFKDQIGENIYFSNKSYSFSSTDTSKWILWVGFAKRPKILLLILVYFESPLEINELFSS